MAEEDRVSDVLPPPPLGDEPKAPMPEPEVKPDEPKDAKKTDEESEDDDEKAGGTADEAGTGEEEPKIKRPGKYRRQIMRQEAQIDALTSTVRELTSTLARPSVGDTPPKSDAKTDLLKPPVEADYEDHVDFQRALARYEVRQEFAAANERQLVADRAAAQVRHAEAARAKFEEAATRYPDFREVALRDDVPISQAMAQFMLSSKHAGDIAYFFGKNPTEAQRIAQLSFEATGLELGRIEDKFLNPVKPKTTTAPAPVKTVKSGDTPAKDPNKMSMAEYAAWRKASEPK